MLRGTSEALCKAEPGSGCSKPVLEFTLNQTKGKKEKEKTFHIQAFEKNQRAL